MHIHHLDLAFSLYSFLIIIPTSQHQFLVESLLLFIWFSLICGCIRSPSLSHCPTHWPSSNTPASWSRQLIFFNVFFLKPNFIPTQRACRLQLASFPTCKLSNFFPFLKFLNLLFYTLCNLHKIISIYTNSSGHLDLNWCDINFIQEPGPGC